MFKHHSRHTLDLYKLVDKLSNTICINDEHFVLILALYMPGMQCFYQIRNKIL